MFLNFMKEMITIKENTFGLRDECKVIMPKFNKIRYGRNTFSYYGSHLWNLLPNELKRNVDLKRFKELLHTWERPACSCNICQLIVFNLSYLLFYICFSHIIAFVLVFTVTLNKDYYYYYYY